MGRSLYAIVGIGVASMLLLSVMMQHFLKATKDRTRSPIVQELVAGFGERLDAPPKLSLRSVGGAHKAVVTIQPLVEVGERSLAREVGEFVWRRIGDRRQLSAVTVVTRSWADDSEKRHDVPCPFVGRPTRQAGTRPPARPRTAPAAAATPRPAPAEAGPPSPPTSRPAGPGKD